MQSIRDCLADDHKRCDALFLQVEAGIAARDWCLARRDFRDFCQAWLGHLDNEETIVFPALEKVVFNGAVPIAMLCMEHGRMRGLVARLNDALERQDPVDFLLHAETLTILAQQHSLKEEDMLYPLLDRLLSGNARHIVAALQQAMDCRNQAAYP